MLHLAGNPVQCIVADVAAKPDGLVRGTHGPVAGQAPADAKFDRLISTTRAFRDADTTDSAAWPNHVPHPSGKNEFPNGQDKAAFDLLCIAGAYIFLHEVQHVRFDREGNKPANPRDEEHACDEFAREFSARTR